MFLTIIQNLINELLNYKLITKKAIEDIFDGYKNSKGGQLFLCYNLLQ